MYEIYLHVYGMPHEIDCIWHYWMHYNKNKLGISNKKQSFHTSPPIGLGAAGAGGVTFPLTLPHVEEA